MAYDLHIERMGDAPDSEPTPIPLADWSAAVAATDGVRLFAAQAHTVTNPKTGEVISIPTHQGDAEVLFPDTGQWHSVFRWRGGSAVFAGRLDPGDTSHPVWAAAVALASRLSAVIRGDEGEIYDLQTGEIVDG
jgi:hypothetical protein